jgi:D-alanyl-lipoteichoic acid acyltransferase DltB (MBOAT superfamily)
MLGLLEWFCHNLVFPTIANNPLNRAIWENFTAYQYILASYFILKWIWLKFTVMWRFFRLWALCDGIESPENMGRCMSNNYCFEDFWRQWHRAFNQWLIRYLFVPLGGSRYKIYNIWVVFGFVAIWHDLSMNLLAWGWGMCLFIMPEVMVKRVFASNKFAEFRQTITYNWMCAMGGGFYIILMMIANLVGFSFGISGLSILMGELLTPEGLLLLSKAFFVLTIGTHWMFAFRLQESQRGIKRNF